MAKDWSELFQIGFDKAKTSIQEKYPLESDRSGDRNREAFRKISERLPFAVKVLELETDPIKFQHIKDKICPMIYYDVSKYNSSEVKLLGTISSKDKIFEHILKTEFHMDSPEQFIDDFNKKMIYTGEWNSNLTENLQFFFYDPKKDIERFTQDFTMFIESPIIEVLSIEFKTQPDYNQKYQLKSEPILFDQELLKKFQIKEYVNSVTNYQEHVSEIQLIPQVNEHVKKVMNYAKKLYIFGGYVYDFFIVAEHYSVLALESAIKHRYFEHFSKPIQIKNKNENRIIPNGDYSDIVSFCEHQEGWDVRHIQVNGEPFLHTLKDLLEWLLGHKIITIWYKKQCMYHMKKRNQLSHLTFAPTHGPSSAYRSIEKSTFLINKMFASLKYN